MQVTYHIGMHCTDNDAALNCLLRNADALTDQGRLIARPDPFRPALRDAMLTFKGAPSDLATQTRLLQTVSAPASARHMLFSSGGFLCVPERAVAGATLYPLVSERVPWIRNLFPDAAAHFCLAIRNPATWLPALHSRFSQKEDFDALVGRIAPEDMLWSDMIARLQEASSDAPLTVWCHEDAPLLWPEILSALTGLPADTPLTGTDDVLRGLMHPDGLRRMQAYLVDHPPRDALHRRKIVGAFLDKFALPEALEQDFEHPLWTEARLQDLTSIYEADLARIAGLPGLTFLRTAS